MSIKDKRVDKMLLLHNLTNTSIYYSPITIWFLTIFMVLGIVCPIFLLSFYSFFSKYYLLFLIYFVFGYIICAYLNNSIVLTKDALIIINPNFPFKQFKTYLFDDIKQIIIDKTKYKWHYIFGIFSNNYIKIQNLDKTQVYFCVGLELETYDENFTNKTIDELNHELKNKGISTIFNLDK